MDRYGNTDLLWFLAPLDNVIYTEVVKRKLMVGLRRAGAKTKTHVAREAQMPQH